MIHFAWWAGERAYLDDACSSSPSQAIDYSLAVFLVKTPLREQGKTHDWNGGIVDARDAFVFRLLSEPL